MANKNTESTRYYSQKQETAVAKALGGTICPNSGAGNFNKSDVQVKEASLSIECKTCMKDQTSFSIKKDWIIKHRDEAFAMRLQNHCIAFNFGPGQPNYYVIDENLMKQLVEYLESSLA
jgi:hypothetical protein